MSDEALNEPAELPQELRGWNWGAFLLNWIWGLGNRTFIALLALIPGVNLIVMVVLGVKGSEWAWRNNKWYNAKHFRQTQRNWAIAGFIIWAGFLLIVGGTLFGIQSIMKNNGAYQMSLEALRADGQVIAAFGEPLEDGWFPSGSVSVENSRGEAYLEIPISGPKASGTGYSEAVREAGLWRIVSLKARVEGSDDVIVVVPAR